MFILVTVHTFRPWLGFNKRGPINRFRSNEREQTNRFSSNERTPINRFRFNERWRINRFSSNERGPIAGDPNKQIYQSFYFIYVSSFVLLTSIFLLFFSSGHNRHFLVGSFHFLMSPLATSSNHFSSLPLVSSFLFKWFQLADFSSKLIDYFSKIALRKILF